MSSMNVSTHGAKLFKQIRERPALCINLDPPITLPPNNRKQWLLNLIKQTSEYSTAIKINLQYIIGMSLEDLQEITEQITESSNVAILDAKISDIGASNEANLHWAKQAGFHMVTASPFPGNAKELAEHARNLDLDIINLVLMSNPEAKWLVKSILNNEPVYMHFARMTQEYFLGAVIGAGGYITEEHLTPLQSILQDRIILVPGIGAQGGKTQLHEKIFHDQILFSVGRAIARARNPREKAQEYYQLIKAKY